MRPVLNTVLVMAAASLAPGVACAQETQPADTSPLQLGVTYNAQHSNLTTGPYFWLDGADAALAGRIHGGFGLALNVSWQHTSNIDGTGMDLTLRTAVLGPRYTWSTTVPGNSERPVEIFGEALFGVSEARGSVFREGLGVDEPLDSFAAQVGGGIDVALSRHWSLRVLQVQWLRTNFRNDTTDEQDNLRVGSGIVYRFPSGSKPVAASVPPAPVSAPTVPAPVPAPIPIPRDTDGDGVLDPTDRCPDTPKGDMVDADGCTLTAEITLHGVVFATNSAELTAESLEVLTGVEATLRKHPALVIEIQGHTDSRASDQYNLRLSQLRADAVMQHLQRSGSGNTLTAVGYGEAQPVADNGTEAGRQANRRVVLKILSGMEARR